MPITVNCACGASMRVKDEWAGRRARCPQCKQPLTVPTQVEPSGAIEAVAVDQQDDTRVIPKPKPTKPRERGDEDDRPRRLVHDEDDDVIDAEVYREERSSGVSEKPRSRARLERDDDGEDDDRPRRRPDDRHRDPPRPRGTGRVDDARPTRRRQTRESGGGIHISAGVLGGLAMMGLAVVWFVVGLYAGWIFFYPPILFIIGVIAFVKGLMGHED